MQTPDGAIKAKKTMVDKYGSDFYARIGALGGKTSRSGGFASKNVGVDGLTGIERARIAGSIGGQRSRKPNQTIITLIPEKHHWYNFMKRRNEEN